MSLFRKAEELYLLTNADVYFFISFVGKSFVCRFTEDSKFPPSLEEISQLYPLPKIKCPSSYGKSPDIIVEGHNALSGSARNID